MAANVIALQRTIGNQAVGRLLASGRSPGPIFRQGVATAAEELREAIEGLGTDEDTIFRVLQAHSGSAALRREYVSTTGRTLESDLRDDLSGSELDTALRMMWGHSAALWSMATRLRDAMEGAGTNEVVVLDILRGQASEGERTALRGAYQDLTGRQLRADIVDDFSGDELREALLAYDEGPLTPLLQSALRLRNAMSGLGTNEEAVYSVLEALQSPAAIEEMKAAYQRLTERTLEQDIRDDFSGAELERALHALGMGTFTNRLPQDMFEGQVTVVQGRFDWRFEDGQLKVNVNANFTPDEGVDVPLATWQSQIDSVWNQYALVEPGGLSIPIQMSLTNASGGKTIRVVQNTVPGTYASPDRANAGKWYPVMPADTAPHEYGHLIGLQDEYQRTHDDFEDITGSAPVGPTNTSGKSEADIATELNTALTDADETQRAPLATTVLTNVGLFVGGLPQQGDFAQAVMTAYDGAYSPSLRDTLAGLPRDGRWALQTVFSYASGTIMGNPGWVPHEHPVAARHLREFVNIAESRFPGYEWSSGNR
jgi:hypothetical protein